MLDLTKNMVLSPVFLAIFSVILSIALQGIIFKEKDFAHALVVLRDFNFAAVGDWGCGINARNTLNNILDKKPELVSITNATAGTATTNETIELDLLPIHSSSYHYKPSLTLTGSNYTDIESNSTLELTQFSVATWFRTTMDVPFGFNAYIVNKGGIGSDSKGSNMNYGIWMTSSETIRAGFEDSSGVPYDIESQGSRNLYVLYGWHYVVATYDGSILRLYIDGVQITSKSTSGATPDNTGIQPVRIGSNSLAPNDFFIGQVDEVRIWNRTLTDSEIADAYDKGVFNTNEQVLYLPSG
jgi:hypothetical protein